MDIGSRTTPWLIFDGDCAFCTSSVNWLAKRLHRQDGSDPHLTPWQFTDLAAIGTTPERAQQEVLWLTPSGEISGGAQAFAAWLRHRGGAYGIVGTAMGLPVIRQLAGVVYRLIAKNRQRMPGGTPACAMRPPSAP